MTRASSPGEHDRVAGRLAGELGRDTSQLARRARPCRRSTRWRARPRHEPARPSFNFSNISSFSCSLDPDNLGVVSILAPVYFKTLPVH
ncbi:hypothetical protein DY000_02021574 [Brassica cretica]|uniref:Uncharacterized protein n=1 Tax=Brassica cretica TaxID=69181 RepID=A0ABQ7E8Y3_BRACR|nr:hypothetical protein DY000_02021574 [Brassica cretica]